MRSAAPDSSLTIGMLWHAPNSGNLGVGALALGNIALARRAAVAAGVTPRFELIGFGCHSPITILEDPPRDARIVAGKQFGPVKFATVDEVIQRANASN